MTDRVPSQMMIKKLSLSNADESERSLRDKQRLNVMQALLSHQTTLAALIGGVITFKVFFKMMKPRSSVTNTSSSQRYSMQHSQQCSNCQAYQNALI